jgi:hypothetical protein
MNDGVPGDKLHEAADEYGRDRWGEDWTTPSRQPDIDALPPMDVVAEKFDRVCDLAAEHLEGRIQTRIKTWEDGEFEIRVYHGYGPCCESGERLRAVLRYHSRSGDVDGALVVVDGDERKLVHRETLANIGAVDVES